MLKIKNKIYKTILALLVSVSLLSFVFFLKVIKTTQRPNVLLITVDALRADHLGCYGYPRNTSPNIDKLAKEGATFLKCFSVGPTTAHSFPSFLTGKYLWHDQNDILMDNILDNKFTTISEYLKGFGYRTAAFVSTRVLRTGRGFEQGFDYYKSYAYVGKDGPEIITNDVLGFLNRHRSRKPIFVWVHYINPHAPYAPPEEFFNIFYNDKLYKEHDKILKLKPKDLQLGDAYSEWTSWGFIPPIVFHKDRYNLNYYVACYDAEISHTDFYIGKLLEDAKDNTVVVLSADHGESLGEHEAYFSHGENIYDELLHVPLIIKDNGHFKGARMIPEAVSAVDIIPTILSRINPGWYRFSKNKFDGKDLTKAIDGNGLGRAYIYSYTSCVYWIWSIRDIRKNFKYILYNYYGNDSKQELYRLPDENKNLIDDNSLGVTLIKKELRENLKSWRKRYPARSDVNPKKVSIDEATEHNLRNLGYLQ